MRDYSIVTPQFWLGKTGVELRGDKDAQLVALYLMTSPHSNMIGVFHCPPVYISHETGMPLQGASKALRRVCQGGFATFEGASEVVFVHEMARFQVGESLKPNDNRVKRVIKEYGKIANLMIKNMFYDRYGEAYHLPEPEKYEAPSKPLRSQEQEQEQEQDQEQDQEQEQDNVNVMSSSPKKRKRKTQEKPTKATQEVFEDWQKILNHPRARLCADVHKKIKAALDLGYTRQDLQDAFVGASRSSHNVGLNARNTKYDKITLILRDSENIQRFMSYREDPPRPAWNGDRPGPQLANDAIAFWQSACTDAVAECQRQQAGEYIDNETGRLIQ